MNYIDVVFIIGFILMAIRGVRMGFVRQACSLGGLVIGLTVGTWLTSLTDSMSRDIRATASTAIIVACILVSLILAEYAGHRVKRTFREHWLDHLDRSFGSAMGIIMCVLLIWFSSIILPTVPNRSFQYSVRDSAIISLIDDRLPAVTDVASHLEEALEQSELGRSFGAHDEPALPDAQGTIPSKASLQTVIDASRAAVVRIEGRACTGIGSGSGFVIDRHIIVTNAHVVAGITHPYVYDQQGRHRAEVIGFDPKLDIAVLRVPTISTPPLSFAGAPVRNGDTAVALGYPHGAPFTASPASILQQFTAISRDIYHDTETRNDVIATKSHIETGNSGGPLLNTHGEVIGVIFARSTTYENIGYALDAPAIARVVHTAMQSPTVHANDRCTP